MEDSTIDSLGSFNKFKGYLEYIESVLSKFVSLSTEEDVIDHLSLAIELTNDSRQLLDYEDLPNTVPYVCLTLRELIANIFDRNKLNNLLESQITLKKGQVILPEIIESSRESSFELLVTIEKEKVVWRGQLHNEDREKLENLSSNTVWRDVVKSLYKKCGTDVQFKDLKIKTFLVEHKGIFTFTDDNIDSMATDIHRCYSFLSKYVHIEKEGKLLSKSLSKLNSEEEELSLQEQEKINQFCKLILNNLSFFNKFEYTSSERYKRLEDLAQ